MIFLKIGDAISFILKDLFKIDGIISFILKDFSKIDGIISRIAESSQTKLGRLSRLPPSTAGNPHLNYSSGHCLKVADSGLEGVVLTK